MIRILNKEQGILNDEYLLFLVLHSLFLVRYFCSLFLAPCSLQTFTYLLTAVSGKIVNLLFAFSLFLKNPLSKKLCCIASRSSSNFLLLVCRFCKVAFIELPAAESFSNTP